MWKFRFLSCFAIFVLIATAAFGQSDSGSIAGFATCGLLLWLRDRSALLASENRSIGRLAVGALVAIPFIVTDFRVLAPDFPVRLGALGALLVVTAVLIAGGAAPDARPC